jgi:hypothetical protein
VPMAVHARQYSVRAFEAPLPSISRDPFLVPRGLHEKLQIDLLQEGKKSRRHAGGTTLLTSVRRCGDQPSSPFNPVSRPPFEGCYPERKYWWTDQGETAERLLIWCDARRGQMEDIFGGGKGGAIEICSGARIQDDDSSIVNQGGSTRSS